MCCLSWPISRGALETLSQTSDDQHLMLSNNFVTGKHVGSLHKMPVKKKQVSCYEGYKQVMQSRMSGYMPVSSQTVTSGEIA